MNVNTICPKGRALSPRAPSLNPEPPALRTPVGRTFVHVSLFTFLTVFLLLATLRPAGAACLERWLQVRNITEVAGREVQVSITMNGQGNENALAFSLAFDPTLMTYLGEMPGAGAAGSALLPNASQQSQGRVGYALAKPAGQSFGSGSNELVRVRFQLAPQAASATLAFGDLPIAREVVNNSAGILCSEYTNGIVTITPLITPQITAQPQGRVVQPIQSIATNLTFTVSASGSAPLTYRWHWYGTNLPGTHTSSYTVTNALPADSGPYQVVVTNEGGAVTSQVAQLTVLSPLIPPTITLAPRSQVVSTGETVSMFASAAGTPPLFYQWLKSGANVAGATNAILWLTNITTTQGGTYSLRVTSAAGTVTSPTATLTVSTSVRTVRVVNAVVAASGTVDVPVELVGLGDENSVGFTLEFDPARLELRAINPGTAALGAGFILNTNSAGLVGVAISKQGADVFPAGTRQLAVFTFIATGASGTVPLRLRDAPIPREVADNLGQPRLTSFQDGQINVLESPPVITLDPTNTVAPIFSTALLWGGASGSAPLYYQWQKDGALVPGATSPSLSLNSILPAHAGAYRLVITNAVGSVTSAVANLNVPRVLRLASTNGPTGDLVETPIQLLTAGDENAIGFTLAFDPAHLAVTNVTAGPALANGQINFNTNQPGRLGVVISQPDNASFTRGTQQLATIQWILGQNAGTRQLTFADDPVYRELVDTNTRPLLTDYLGNSITSSLVAPTIQQAPVAKSVWAGTDLVLEVRAGGSKPLWYQWLRNGAPVSGANSPVYTITNIQIADTANYSVQVTNKAGITATPAALITVQAPQADFFVNNVASTANAEPGQSVSVTWTVHNVGSSVASTGWYHTLWLARNSSGSSADFIGAFPFNTALAPGQSTPASATITLPQSILGDRYFVVQADGSNTVAEVNEVNNIGVAPQPIRIALPTFMVTASNNPPFGGNVSGQGSYSLGATSILTANPGTGYKFGNWTENGVVIATTPSITNVISTARFFVANYDEANTVHYVTSGSVPTNIATVAGVGTYTNRQVVTISAPASITNPPNVYNFKEFRLNGVTAGNTATFQKTFSTLDPVNMQYVAVYDTISILPLVTNVVVNLQGTIPATTNLQISFTFNRSMNPAVTPQVALTNTANGARVAVSPGGAWRQAVLPNDTFSPPPITLGAGQDGTYNVWIAAARDLGGYELSLTNARTLQVDVTPPPNPSLALSASNSTSATLSWAGYAPPSDLNAFRLFIAPSNFTSLANLTAVSSVGSTARSFTYAGLQLDTPYWVLVSAVDNAGNSATAVTPFVFTLTSSVPPPVIAQLSPSGATSASLSWDGYNSSSLLGFQGFHVYYETNAFSSVQGLTPRHSLSSATRTLRVDNLDRRFTYYFAVVGYNTKGVFNPSVTTVTWSDPYAGNIATSLTVGQELPVVDIFKSITLVNNAVLTIHPGTALRFAPGTGITVQQGALVANGTALDPVVFTSSLDQPGSTPSPGDWNGITLQAGAGNSLLRHVFVNYGAGLTVSNCNPRVDAFTALNNAPAGLSLSGTSTISTTNALLAYNGIGARQTDSARLVITQSVLKNNNTNALTSGTSSLIATQNWWGSALPAEVDPTLRGQVDRAGLLTGEPLLTPALGTVNNVTQVGGQFANLRLACRTADSMRLSEDSTFPGVFFEPFTNSAPFPLSTGGGLKTIFAQYRSLTGQTSAPVSITVTYITTGPTISAFSLAEGMTLTRPVQVTASATAPLGVARLELYVDGVGVATNLGSSFSQILDVRSYSSGTRRARLVARDNSGNIATRELNLLMAPTPPPAPTITTPATDLIIATNNLFVAGNAEPFIQVRLFRSGSLVGTTTAAANGAYIFSNVVLSEGLNELSAMAFDALGSASSLLRNVTMDTQSPAQLILDPPLYQPGIGLTLSWKYPNTGKRATRFQVLWSTSPITSISQATGTTLLLSGMGTTLQGLSTGNYLFYVVGYDGIGNVSPLSSPLPYYYDAIPPSFTISFSKPSPVGLGALEVLLVSSEPLSATPSLTVQLQGAAPVLVSVTNLSLNTYAGAINVTPVLSSGLAQFRVTASDVAGNPFNGAPSGPTLTLDVTPPVGFVATQPPGPIQTTNNVDVLVSLQLSEAPQPGSKPMLTFSPPVGTPVILDISGSRTNWTAPLSLDSAMGSGLGYFTMRVSDALGNEGQNIRTGNSVELYNTSLPSPPGQPVGFTVGSLSTGRVGIVWQVVPNAEIYRVYCETGTTFVTPTVLVADNLTSNEFIHLPTVDGQYRYAVTASRRGAEGPKSIVRIGVSDRTPPGKPSNVAVQLAPGGLQISWQEGPAPAPALYNVYRNGTFVRQVGPATTAIYDTPPRGLLSYTVAASDQLGNLEFSEPATYEMWIGAVDNLHALISNEQAARLSWTTPDNTTTGVNVYRNGVKQNNSPITGTNAYTDPLPLSAAIVTYAVTAVNSTNAESAARSLQVFPLNIGFLVNPNDSGEPRAPIRSYFDQYRASATNLALNPFPLKQVEIQRITAGSPAFNYVEPVNSPVGVGNSRTVIVAVPGAISDASQSVRIRAVQQTDAEGSSVAYERLFELPPVQSPGVMVELSVDQLPLAGGLSPFNVKVYNRGHAPMYFVTARGNGSKPGDVYISVLNPQGQEVSRTPYTGILPGAFFNGETAYAVVPAGGATSFTVPDVLVPEALASNTVTFLASIPSIYDRATTTGQQASGPLSGTMQSTLSQTPYFATLQTDYQIYSNSQPVLITGKAVNRSTGLPLPNAPLKIGFATRGHSWSMPIISDASGNYTYVYNVQPGLSGSLMLWAAHPDIYDQLNQAQIEIYRVYAGPSSGDIRMSKNDVLPFKINLLNPGDIPLSNFKVGFSAYNYQGTNQIPITTITGKALFSPPFNLGPGEKRDVLLQLTAAADAPDTAVVEFSLQAEQGAAATFVGNVTLLPAVPLISVVSPAMGYVETSLDRGTIQSREITIVNRGLKDLKGVTLQPPTNVLWMRLNLPAALPDGTIALPDLAVGKSNTFSVVFVPPPDTALGYFQDRLILRGTNAQSTFGVNLYTRVTSASKGAVQFYVDNILGLDVPNATVRLRNTALGIELPPSNTDINGLVTVTNLQEGEWSWQISAAGHSANVGSVTLVPDQTINVSTRLNKSVVTVNFTVTPVPFTDKYEITLEQTFETHVPAPVLVMRPAFQHFEGVEPGYQATFIVTTKNEGLIQMTDLTLKGSQTSTATFEPLITYVPVLLPQQTLEIPFTFTYHGTNGPSQQAGPGGAIASCSGFGSMDEIGGFLEGLGAFANAYAQCAKDKAWIVAAASVAVTYQLFQNVTKGAKAITAALQGGMGLAKYLGCILGKLIGAFEPTIALSLPTLVDLTPKPTVPQFVPMVAGCFDPDTLVLMGDGTLKQISALTPGDIVKSGPSPRELATISDILQKLSNDRRSIAFARNSGTETVVTTDEHLFWLDGQGWVAASHIKPGEWLLDSHGRPVRVVSNTPVPEQKEVFTLRLRGDRAFYANGVLVHDLCGEWDDESVPLQVSQEVHQ